MNTPSCLGYASLSISDPEKCSGLSAKGRNTRKQVPWGIARWGLFHRGCDLFQLPGDQGVGTRGTQLPVFPRSASSPTEKGLTKRHALYLSTITAFLALLTSHYPLSAFDVEVYAFGGIATLHITDRFLWVSLLDEVSHERLVPDRTPLRPRKCL